MLTSRRAIATREPECRSCAARYRRLTNPRGYVPLAERAARRAEKRRRTLSAIEHPSWFKSPSLDASLRRRRRRRKNESDAQYSARRARRARRRHRLATLAGIPWGVNPKKARGFWQVHIGGAFSRTFSKKSAASRWAKRHRGTVSWFTPVSQRNPRRLCVECARMSVYRPKGHKGPHGDPVLLRWMRRNPYKTPAWGTRTHCPVCRRGQASYTVPGSICLRCRKRRANPRPTRRRSSFRNPSEKATMASAMRAAWRAIKRA